MKPDWEDDYEIPGKIDLTKGKWVRNPFIQEFQELNLVSLDADVKAAFPNSESVNKGLRGLIEARQKRSAA